MARHTTIDLTSDTYTELTNADVTSITIAATGGDIWLFPTTTAGSPGLDNVGAILLPRGQALINEALADLFPGVASVARVHGRAQGVAAKAYVSHA